MNLNWNHGSVSDVFKSINTWLDIKRLETIEEYLINSGIHVGTVKEIMNYLVQKVAMRHIDNTSDIYRFLHQKIVSIIKPYAKAIDLNQEKRLPQIILVFGINGSGKTTTAGKMVNLLSSLGWSTALAACDTFRAAAKEQLEYWSRVPNVAIVYKEHDNESPAKIATKALLYAMQNNMDVVLVDTAGRVHSNTNLVLELLNIQNKLLRVRPNSASHNVLILDANSGYNAMHQVETFQDKIGIDGIILTKIDISQKLGIIISICTKYKLPIYGISDGETRDNIRDLDAVEFADILLQNLVF